jgi:hypothetical protein
MRSIRARPPESLPVALLGADLPGRRTHSTYARERAAAIRPLVPGAKVGATRSMFRGEAAVMAAGRLSASHLLPGQRALTVA